MKDTHICRQMALFSCLTEAEWTALSAQFPQPEQIPAGEPLLPAGEPTLLLLLDGQARVTTSGHGRTVVMRRLAAGDVCGAAMLFGEHTPVSRVTALTDCRVIGLPRETVRRFLCECPGFAVSYVTFLTGRIRFLNRRIADCTENSADERLLYYIREHLTPDGEFAPSDSMLELARTLNVGRSSLYRALEHLTEQGYLEETAKRRWRYKEVIL